jgi:hypothetical protein
MPEYMLGGAEDLEFLLLGNTWWHSNALSPAGREAVKVLKKQKAKDP